jgi:hypothetical protein
MLSTKFEMDESEKAGKQVPCNALSHCENHALNDLPAHFSAQ